MLMLELEFAWKRGFEIERFRQLSFCIAVADEIPRRSKRFKHLFTTARIFSHQSTIVIQELRLMWCAESTHFPVSSICKLSLVESSTQSAGHNFLLTYLSQQIDRRFKKKDKICSRATATFKSPSIVLALNIERYDDFLTRTKTYM